MIVALVLISAVLQQPPAERLAVDLLPNGLRYRVDEVPAASHVCVLHGVRLRDRGAPLESPGMAEIYTAAVESSLVTGSDRQASVWMMGTTLLVAQTIPRADLAPTLAGIRARLAEPLPLDADAYALARARARLRADDLTQVLPGPILKDRARRLFMPELGATVASPDQIQAHDLASFVAWQNRCLAVERSFVFLFGGVTALAGKALVGEHLADLAAVSSRESFHAEGTLRGSTSPALRSSHRQVRAPFVSLAVPVPAVPGDLDRLAFAVGVSVLSQRAAFDFGAYRAGESQARFPFVDYDLIREDVVALVNRRGFDGGQAASVIQEISELYQQPIERGFSDGQVQRAAHSLAARLRLPPYAPATQLNMARLWRMLYSKVLVLAAYEVWNWPREICERIESVQTADVDRVMRQQMASDRVLWLSLEPAERNAASIFER